MSSNKNKKTEELNRRDDEDEDVIDDENLDPRSIDEEYLKSIAEDGFNTSWKKLAEEMEIPESRAESIINECVQMMLTTYKEADFPQRMLDFYNSFAMDEESKLTVEDVVVLMKLVNHYYDKIKPKEKELILAKMRKLGRKSSPDIGFDPREHAQPVPDIPQQSQQEQLQQVTFTDTHHGQHGQQQVPPAPMQQVQQQQQDPYSQYESDEALMKYLLEMNYSVRDPQRIQFFLQHFRLNKNDWLTFPVKMLVALRATFGNVVAESVLQMFMDAKMKMPNNAAALYQLTGASNYQPIVDPRTYLGQAAQNNPAFGAFMNQYGGGLGQFVPPTATAPGQDEDDKAFKRLSNVIGMNLMHKMAESQMGGSGSGGLGSNTPGAVGGFSSDMYDIKEEFDNTGRMTGRTLIRKAYPMYPGPTTQNPANDKSNDMLMKFMELMMTSQNSDKQLLMQKVLQGDTHGMNEIIGTILKQAVGAMTQTTDPAVALGKYLELGERVAALKQQPQKSIEEKKIEMDYLLAKTEITNKENEKMREFRRQEAEATDANERYRDTVKEVGNIIKEAAGPAIEIIKTTMGRGLAPGAMPGGTPMYPPGYQPPSQQQQPRVVVQQVPVQPQQQQQQQQPQYTPDQVRLMQEEQARREAEQMAELHRQQEMENRPIEDALAEMPTDQLADLVRRYEEDSTRLEFTGNKIMAEMAKRKGRGFTPSRNHVSPVVEAIREHEQANPYNQYYAPVAEPEPISVNPFEPEDSTYSNINTDTNPSQNTNTTNPIGAGPAAVDISDSYNDDEIKESLRVQGLLSEDEGQTRDNLNLDDNASVGVPTSVSMQSNQQQQQQQEPQEELYEVDADAMVEDSGDTVVE